MRCDFIDSADGCYSESHDVPFILGLPYRSDDSAEGVLHYLDRSNSILKYSKYGEE